MKTRTGLLNMWVKIVTYTLIAALSCQDMAMAIAPRSMFEAPVGTKVGRDQSPVPSDVVTEFISWAKDNGAVIEEGENGLKILKKLETVELKRFKKDGYTIREASDAFTFIYNAEKKSDAYILRDSDGNRYVTEMFYSHYVNAPPNIKFQEVLHEVFEHEWDRLPEIDKVLEIVFSRLDVEERERAVYRHIFSKKNIEGFGQVTSHILAELAEKLATIIYAVKREGEDIDELKELNLTELNRRVKVSELDLFIGKLGFLPLTKALEKDLERGLKDEPVDADPNFDKYINEHNEGTRGGIVELSCSEIKVFLDKWLNGEYPDIREEDLDTVIEKIVNRWMLFYKKLGIEERKKEGDPVTIHYSAWEDSCSVEALLVIRNKCYISLNILNRKIGFIVPIPRGEEAVSVILDEVHIEEVKYDSYLIMKFKDLRGDRSLENTLQDPGCRSCIEEMIDGLGWETMVQVLNKNEDSLGVPHSEMEGFLERIRDEMRPRQVLLKCAYPEVELLEYTKDVSPAIHITKPLDEALAREAILVLEDVANKIPRVKETLIDSLVERIRTGKVSFGKHFIRPAIAVEDSNGGHFILVSQFLEDVLLMNSVSAGNRSIRGIFFASILLGQEAQIWLRQNKGADWDDPGFNNAFIAQAAELQVMTLYKYVREFMLNYVIFMESIPSNSWGEINVADLMGIHCGVRAEGTDCQFLEGRVDTILMYKEHLRSMGLLEFSKEALRSASVTKIHDLLEEIGLKPILRFSDLPPVIEGGISVTYGKRVNKIEVLSEEDIISGVKDIYIPIQRSGEHSIQRLGDMVDKGFFSGLTIDVDTQVKKVSIRLDIKALQFHVTIPAIKEKDEWLKCCDTFEIIPGEVMPVVYTNAYEEFNKERNKNLKALEEAQRYVKKGDLDTALRIVQRRLDITPMSHELIFFMVQIILPRRGDFDRAMELLHNTFRDHRLYQRGQGEMLLRLISTAVSLENIRSTSGDPLSVSDIIYLAETAKRQYAGYLRDVENDRQELKRKRRRFEEALYTTADKKDAIQYQLRILGVGEGQLTEEEQRMKELINNIAISVAYLCFNRDYHGVVDYWLGQAGSDLESVNREKSHKSLLSKAWRGIAGSGESISEDEVREIFKYYENRQKENPLDSANLNEWGYYLYTFWKFKYPEKREYLEEAEKRFEQYIALYPIHEYPIPEHLYLMGMVKYHLGKLDEALIYLGQFFTTAPRYLSVKLEFLEGKTMLNKLRKDTGGEKDTGLPRIYRGHKVSDSAVRDLVENYLGPFIKTGFGTISAKDRHRFVYLYLKFLRETGEVNKAYLQAQEWLDSLTDIDIDMLEEIAILGMLLNKEAETREIIQQRLAVSRDKDIMLDYADAAILKEKGDLAVCLKLLDSCVDKYKPRPREEVGDAMGKILADIFVERADIYIQMGQFNLAKRDWEYIREQGWRPASLCNSNINLAERLERSLLESIGRIYIAVDVEQYPEIVIDRFNEILRQYPHNRHVLRARNTIMSYNGRFKEAEKEYLSLLDIYPYCLEFRLDLAYCSLIGSSPKAVEYYRQYIEHGGDINPILDQLGTAYFFADRWEDVIRYYTAYIKAVKKDDGGRKPVGIDICINLVISYGKLGRWDEANRFLIQQFTSENIKEQSRKVREQVAKLFLECGMGLVQEEEPDWGQIEILKRYAAMWLEGLGMEGDLKGLDDEIEVRRLMQQEEEAEKERKKTIAEERRQLELIIRTLRNRLSELEKEVVDEDRLRRLNEEIEKLIHSAGSSAETEEIKARLPGVLETARARIRERNEGIEGLKKDIADRTKDIVDGREVPESAIKVLFNRAKELKVLDRQDVNKLLEDLRAAEELVLEERRKKERERRLRELNERFDIVEKDVKGMIEELQDLPPKTDPHPILDRYRRVMAGFLGVETVGDLRDVLRKLNLLEEFTRRILSLDNLFMGKYGQAKGRKKLKVKQAFDRELEDALNEIDTIPITKDGSIIARRREIHDLLMRPVARVLYKYERLPEFSLTQGMKRKALRLAERRIASVIRKAEEEAEKREIAEAERDKGKEDERIKGLLKRQQAVKEVVSEWTDTINSEVTGKPRGDVDFDLIRQKGEELADRLEGQGIFLSYEEAFSIQSRILRVLNPNPVKARFSWEKVYPLVQAVSMTKRDMPRAMEEVDRCFMRPQIEAVDEEIFSILDGDSIIRGIQSANDNPRQTRDWSIRLGSTKELMRLGVITDPKEILMIQIHLLRKIYTDDPENQIDPDSPDYPLQIAEVITRRFSEEPGEFLYDLERTRLKLIPRQEPRADAEGEIDQGVSWIRRNLGMHRHLTPDETKGLILLAQKGNPAAMNILKQAHAVTVVNEAVIFAKRTNSLDSLGEHVNNGFLGFSRGVFRYGYHPDSEGQYILQEERFGLHMINPNFLNWIRMPVRQTIERNAKRQAGDVTDPLWLQDEKRLLYRARGQVYRDIAIVRSMSGMLEKDKDKIKKIKRNIQPEVIQGIALATGLKPLEVLGFLINCPVSELYVMARDRLPAEVDVRFVGMSVVPEGNKVFADIIKEKNKDWKGQNAKDLTPLVNVLTGGKDIVWWLEKREGEDLKEALLGYLERLYNLILEIRKDDFSNDNIAPLVEYIASISPVGQSRLDTGGVQGIESLDRPVSDDSDTSLGEVTDLGGFVDQRTPEAELEMAETPYITDVRGLSMEAFETLREKVIGMLDKLGERIMGERESELEGLRPKWEEGSARLEDARSLVREIEEKLEAGRREKLKALGPITEKMEGIKGRYNDRLKELLAQQERERSELSAKQRQELAGVEDGHGLTTGEKRAHWVELQREVLDYINERKREIQGGYDREISRIEERAQVARLAERMEFEKALASLDSELTELRSRHSNEIENAKLRSEPEEMKGPYPDFPDTVERGSVAFNRGFWEDILARISSISIDELPGEILDKVRPYASCPIIKLICTVLVPLCFDKRLWDLIDQNDLELQILNVRLNHIKAGRRPQLDGFYDEGYGVNEANIFSEQIAVLIKIVGIYRKYLTAQAMTSVDTDEIRERQTRELETKEAEIRAKKEEAKRPYEEELARVEGEKQTASGEAAGRRDEALALIEEERNTRLEQVRAEHKKWIKYSKKEAMVDIHRRQVLQLEKAQLEARNKLEVGYKEELAPLQKEFETAFTDLNRRIEGELGGLAENIRMQEDLGHDIEKLTRAIAEERDAILQGNTAEDRGLIERQRAEWELFVDSFGRQKIGTLHLNGYIHWDGDILRLELARLLKRTKNDEKKKRIKRYISRIKEIEKRQAEEERQLKDRQRERLLELDREEARIRDVQEQLQEDEGELFRMRERLFSSEKYLIQWLEEELISLRKLERDFEPLNRRYEKLEQLRLNFERAKSMFLDRMGLSSTALEAGGSMKLEEIAGDPRYQKQDGTRLTRERVRQIIKGIRLQLLVFNDMDELDIGDVPVFEKLKDMKALLARLKIDEGIDGEDSDDLGRFYLYRNELFSLLRTIIAGQDEDAVNNSINIIRLFLIKNQLYEIDIYRITAEVAHELIDALKLGDEVCLRFEEGMGEMRVKMLLEPQMSPPKNRLKPYSANLDGVLTRLEGRFAESYTPQDDFPWFPTTDKNWLSRDELVRLGFTWNENPDSRERIKALLGKFVEEQGDRYPDSKVEEVVKELTGIEIQPCGPGLIGKYVPVSRVIFAGGYIQFRAYRVDDLRKAWIDIRIQAEEINPALFNNFRRTGIHEIDTALEKFLAGFKGKVYILSSNQYGIDGIGTHETLAVLESISNNPIALFHELTHAAGVDIVKYINAGREELYLYLRSKGPQMSQHYAIRLFQRQKWESDDRALTRLIKIDRLKTERDRRIRIEIAKQLGLDIRPTENGLLDVQHVGHDMAVKDIVNPNNEHKVAVYGCSGADWSNIILSTNADTIYFVDRTPIDVEKLQRLLATEWDKLNDIAYLLFKYAHGYSLSEATMPEIEYKILLELKLMGVKKDTIKITNNTDGSVNISFKWAYKRQGAREYSITYIQADIKRPSEYPDALKKVLEGGIDVYYQRAGLLMSDYHYEFIHEISRAIKEGGYILADGAPYYEGVIYIEELKHWERFIEFLDPVKVGNPLYGRFVNIWQKKAVMTRDRFKSICEEDIGFTKRLLGELKGGRIYEVRYNAKRLSESQQELIKEYCARLNAKTIPILDVEEDYIIRVSCRDKTIGEIGNGQINLEGEDGLGIYPLRIIGMLNIVFAVSSIKDSDDPHVGFIREQYKAITGKELGEGADIRRIILPLPERIDLEEADRLNCLARELLTAA